MFVLYLSLQILRSISLCDMEHKRCSVSNDWSVCIPQVCMKSYCRDKELSLIDMLIPQAGLWVSYN